MTRTASGDLPHSPHRYNNSGGDLPLAPAAGIIPLSPPAGICHTRPLQSPVLVSTATSSLPRLASAAATPPHSVPEAYRAIVSLRHLGAPLVGTSLSAASPRSSFSHWAASPRASSAFGGSAASILLLLGGFELHQLHLPQLSRSFLFQIRFWIFLLRRLAVVLRQ